MMYVYPEISRESVGVRHDKCSCFLDLYVPSFNLQCTSSIVDLLFRISLYNFLISLSFLLDLLIFLVLIKINNKNSLEFSKFLVLILIRQNKDDEKEERSTSPQKLLGTTRCWPPTSALSIF